MLADVQRIELTETLAAVDRWLQDYVRQPHPQLGRSGPVCPFVAPSQRADALEARVRLIGPNPGVCLIVEMLRCALEEFELIGWRGSNPALRALIVVIPDLPDDRLCLLDAAQQVVKPEAVRRGLMIGQFHALCQEPAARNAEFPVNRSPVPLVALRPMAMHDILFLRDRRDWFTEYLRRFGDRFGAEKIGIDPLFTRLFEQACAEHGLAL
jgi:heptaprenyl diphosphate synthase